MELRTIIPGENIDAPVVVKSEGDAPKQIESFDEVANSSSVSDFASDLYGDEEFDLSEIDEDGFSDFDASQDESYNSNF